MDKLLLKKINLLVHLAKVDGKFHETEQKLLNIILNQKGLKNQEHQSKKPDLDDFKTIEAHDEKTELLYWSIKMIQADKIIHPEEIAYCKALAHKLSFDVAVVDYFANTTLDLTLEEFEKQASQFSLQFK